MSLALHKRAGVAGWFGQSLGLVAWASESNLSVSAGHRSSLDVVSARLARQFQMWPYLTKFLLQPRADACSPLVPLACGSPSLLGSVTERVGTHSWIP